LNVIVFNAAAGATWPLSLFQPAVQITLSESNRRTEKEPITVFDYLEAIS
jgi:hypothetical protein